MCCRGLHRVASAAYLSPFPFCALPCVAPYCARSGIRVVSTPHHRRLDLRLQREEVLDRKATIGPPALGNLQHLLCRRRVIKAIDLLDGSAECEVTRQNHVGTVKGDDEKAMHRPRADARDRRECTSISSSEHCRKIWSLSS